MTQNEQKIGITSYEGLTPEMRSRMVEIGLKNFGDDLSYFFTSGSIVFNGAISGKSDVDMVAVLQPSVLKKPRIEIVDKIKGFIDDYLKFHYDFNFLPDLEFPAEYITGHQVDDSIAGRAFHADEQSGLYLPRVYDGYYMEDPERWHRAWLSLSAYGEFIVGDREKFDNNKVRAWQTILLFNLPSMTEELDKAMVMDFMTRSGDKKSGNGVSERYFTFREKESNSVTKALEMLARNGFLLPSGVIFVKNNSQIATWHFETAKKILDCSIRNAEYLTSLENTHSMSSYAKQKWDALNRN